MHRIDSATADVDKFGAGKNGYTEGVPGVEAPTETTAAAFDAVQEEILAPIEEMGFSAVKATNSQLLKTLNAMFTYFAVANPIERTNAKNIQLNSVAWGQVAGVGAWVAVGDADGADGYIMRSVDSGRSWAEIAGGTKNFGLNSVHFGNGVFMAVGAADGGDAYILRSTDGGATWAEVANAKNFALRCVWYDYVGKKWVAVGDADGTNSYMLTSVNDGATWTENNSLPAKNIGLTGVCCNTVGTKWVAVGVADGTNSYLLTATDPTSTWTENNTMPAQNYQLNGVAYGNGAWVAVGESPGVSMPLILRSVDDAVTWTAITDGMTTTVGMKDLYKVAFGNGIGTGSNLFVAVGEASTIDGLVLVSATGSKWFECSNPKAFSLYGVRAGGGDSGIEYNNTSIVMVGAADGTDGYLLTSLFLPWISSL